MKYIDKVFKIKKKEQKEQFKFSIGEVILITVAISIFASVLTGYTVYVLNDANILETNGVKDIIETYNKIKNNYYEDVDEVGLSDAAIDGMMKYLDEKYSVYMDDEETSNLNSKLNGNYNGIGIQIAQHTDGYIEIITVYDNTPASKSGLKSGDIIKRVNNKIVTKDTTATELTDIIKKSTNIKIVVMRDKQERSFNIEVKNIDYPVVSSKIYTKKNKRIGYLYLDSFSNTSYKQLKTSLENLEFQLIDSLIIDVRSNTGGYLDAVHDISSLFLKKGKIIYAIESKNKKEIVRDQTKEERDYPIAVLIDGNTASASEILAASLKESYGAILIGDTSYGKGKVQQTSKLSDDTMIKYTTAKWLTPDGNSIDGVGLTPGIKVLLDKKYAKNPTDENDGQLQKAIDFLANN